jgi:hypothetical protein
MIARLCALFLATLAAGSFAADPVTRPKSILVIRHAEKPDDEDDIHLSPHGTKRAGALPNLFRKSAGRPDPFPTPDFIFAAKRSKHSDRSVETVTPLAKGLKLAVNDTYETDDYAKLAEELLSNPKYRGKTVLICWHHGNIPELVARLGAADAPDKWKDAVFDRVWVVTYNAKGKAKALARRAQALLPADAK